MLSGLILSGGESLRMQGKVKALLPLGTATFLETIMAGMRAARVGEIIVVVGAHAEQIKNTLDLSPVRVVHNKSWRLGQIQSLRRGLDEVSDACEGVLVNLVDHPLVRPETYQLVAEEWGETKEKVVIPKYKDRRGHPVIFPGEIFTILQSAYLPDGARGLLRDYPDMIREIPVEDEGVLVDIDTPEEYQAVMRNV